MPGPSLDPLACAAPDAGHLPALTGLRFVLAIWVVLHHLTGKGMMLDAWAQSLPPPVRSVLRGGYLAVGTFFVLSGFVLARSYGCSRWNRDRLIRFGVARMARVYPTYLLSLLMVAPFILEFLREARKGPPLPEKMSLVANYWFVFQGWTGKLPVNWNTPAWSLSCELFFYLCFPLLVVVFGRRTWPRMLLATLVALAIPTVLADLSVPWEFKPLYHLADFLLGIALAGIYDAVVKSPAGARLAGFWLYAPATAAGLVFIAYPQMVERAMTLGGALRPVNAALLVGLALGGGVPARVLSTRVAVYLGKASYSLYILHIPLLWWYKRSGVNFLLPPGGSAVVFICGAVLLSAAAFRWFEEPSNRRIRSWSRGRTTSVSP